MNRKMFKLTTILVVVVLAFILSTSSATAAAGPRVPSPQHAPICYKVPYYIGGVYELNCYDIGKDIASVLVKTELEYELTWDNETVILIVFDDLEKQTITNWAVRDKDGSEVVGTLP